VIIEAGVYLILVFTPFAFAGVEAWAIGVLQILCGVVVSAWALDRLRGGGAARLPGGRAGIGLWIPIVLFVLLVLAQLVPLSPSLLGRLAPATQALYSRTVPGYAEGKDFDTGRLVPWLLERKAGDLPAAAAGDPGKAAVTLPLSASPLPRTAPVRRTLSIYPYDTRLKLTLFLCYLALFTVVLAHFRTPERLERLCLAGTLSATAVTMLGIAQKFTWNGRLYWVREGTYGQVFGPFVDRNTYAAFAGVWMPVAAGMALVALRRLRQGSRDELPRLVMWGGAAVGITGGIFLSLSRGGIIAACVSIVVVAGLLAYYGRSKAEVGLLAGLLAASVLFLVWIGPEMVLERIGTLSAGQGVPSLQYRVSAWEQTAHLIRENALAGTGLGTFRFSFMRYAPPGEGWWNTAHNEYLELLCDTGLIGGALFLWGTVAWLARVARPGRLRGRPERHMYIGITAGLVGLFLHSAISSNLQVPADAILVPILGAALINLVAIGSPRERRLATASVSRSRAA